MTNPNVGPVGPGTSLDRNKTSFMVFAIAMVGLPFLVVRFVPATDLPQHLAQIRLFLDTLQGKSGDMYSISWWGVNSLVYVLLGINWMIFAPIVAGKMLMAELAVGWVISVFVLANRLKRPVESAMLAGLFVFTASFYWGFVNFLLGWPVFVAWYLLVVDRADAQSSQRRVLTILLLGILVLLAHALWLAVAVLVLLISDLRHRVGGKALALQITGLLPVLAYSLIWYQRISHQRLTLTFDTAAHWKYLPWERLNPAWLLDASFGGLRGPIEAIILLGVAAWIVAALYTHRGNLRSVIDQDLLWSAATLGAIVFLVPDKFLNTILFASRWMPPALVLLLVALPPPKLPDVARLGFAALLVVILSASTTLRWYQFDREEDSGLKESLRAVRSHASVVGLDFVKESAEVCGNPFIQTAAYAQVLHGGRLGFSFAEHQSGIVVTDSIGQWTPGLEWLSELVTFEDLAHFDYALVNATDEVHKYLSSLPALSAVTTAGRWRLYTCTGDLEHKGSVFAPLESPENPPNQRGH